MIENLDLLFKRMKASRPVLLLGAGFSYGATNANNTPLLLGKKLSQELHKYFFVEGELSTLDPTMLSEINDKEDDLKEICSYLRLCGKVLERNKFLTAAFKGCKPAPEGFHQKLVKYPWEYIFTLNIDDLVENIYRTAEIPLSVWDASNTTGTNYEHKTNLVKLHGSVNDSKNGYIFDSSEYKNFTIDSNSLLKEFAHQFLQHDLILIGTEFQANNHLLYAHSMRSKSYHVNHALANNELAWGLFLLKNKIGDGNTKFLNGADRMLKIVYNENFSGSYRYSVHSYVRMWLEYAKVTKENLPYETCEVCSSLLESLLDRPLDNMLTTLIKSFIAYCDSNNLKELNFKLKSVYRKREQFHADRGAYDID